jgi:hypothetical protein
MADQSSQKPEPTGSPGTPLVGYRDMPQPTGHTQSLTGWAILAAMTIGYLVWTLVVYFLEPGIR